MQGAIVCYKCDESNAKPPPETLPLESLAADAQELSLLAALQLRGLVPWPEAAFCAACKQLHSDQSTRRRLRTAMCASCGVEATGPLLREQQGRCWRNCFECPRCHAGLALSGTSGAYVLRCRDCAWDSQSALGATFCAAGDVATQLDRLRASAAERLGRPLPEARFAALLEYYRAVQRQSIAESLAVKTSSGGDRRTTAKAGSESNARLAAAAQSLEKLKQTMVANAAASPDTAAATLQLFENISATLGLSAGGGSARASRPGTLKEPARTEPPPAPLRAPPIESASVRRARTLAAGTHADSPVTSDPVPRRFPLSASTVRVCRATGSTPDSLVQIAPVVELRRETLPTVRLWLHNRARRRPAPMQALLTAAPARPSTGWRWQASLSASSVTIPAGKSICVSVSLEDVSGASETDRGSGAWFAVHVEMEPSDPLPGVGFWVVVRTADAAPPSCAT